MFFLGLSGCVSLGGGKAPERLFTLRSDAVAASGQTVSASSAEAVLVVEPDTDRSLALQRVPVQVDANAIAYLKDANWVERPARLFRTLLAEHIRAGGKRLVLEEDGALPAGAMRLGGRLTAMGYDARSHSVVVRYDALRDEGGGKLSARRFEAVEADVPAQAHAVGPALNRAANKVASDVAAWIG
ncbi:MAG TPA: ABC-type transport auxiliary lipoprotein family protein [Novosphingobium sp.]|nr:ABC-type transport auxiliary lipoprotein family protein [Novosphingobium sp.]